MLSENQARRLLGQCMRVDESYGKDIPTELQTEWSINQGWMQALNLVLEQNTIPIRNDWFYVGGLDELIQKLEELIEDGRIEIVIDGKDHLFGDLNKVDKCYNQPYRVDINRVKLKVYLQFGKD